MKCFPLFHDWEPRKVAPYRDVSYGEPGRRATRVLSVCRKCGKPKVEQIDGHWTLAELTGRAG